MTDAEKLYALALNLKAIDDAYEELATFKLEIKARVETLLKESRAIRFEVLSGQQGLPLEPAPTVMQEVLEKTAAFVNSGALDTPGVKCTAAVPLDTTPAERQRTRRAKKKLKGKEVVLAVLPGATADKRTSFTHGHNGPGVAQP